MYKFVKGGRFYNLLCKSPKDNQILDLCLVGKADYLVTGDKDLLEIKRF